jgi:hypothetical protein
MITMGFQKGNQYGKLSKRGQNKVSAEIRQKINALINNLIEDIDIELLSENKKFQLLEMCLKYSIPKVTYKAEFKQTKSESKQKDIIDIQ